MQNKKKQLFNRGDVWLFNLSPATGSEQGGLRPCYIIQNDIGNYYAPTVIAIPMTTATTKHNVPTHVAVSEDEAAAAGLRGASIVLCEQIMTLDKCRAKKKYGRIQSADLQRKIDLAVKLSLRLMD